MSKRGFYDCDCEIEEMTGFSKLDDMLYLRMLQQRKLYLVGEISQGVVTEAVQHIIQYNTEDKGKPVEERQPILLYCTSEGGSVEDGMELIDVILQSKTPVYTINLGYQYSMGFLIGLSGHKRFATASSRYLVHDGSNFVMDSGAKAQDRMDFMRKCDTRIREYVLNRTKIKGEDYDRNYRVEWYMFADEAKELGVTDYIIGVDCELDDVL